MPIMVPLTAQSLRVGVATRYSDAEPHYNRALSIREKKSGVPQVSSMGTLRAVSSRYSNGVACCRTTFCNRSIDLARERLDNSSA
jgi:hypothetical protein